MTISMPNDWTPSTYGREWFGDYDRISSAPKKDTDLAVAALTRLARGRPVLELAAGTGRIAVPLARNGLAVTATDISPEMLSVLASHDPEHRVVSRVEDMTSEGTPEFGLVALLLNSLFTARTSEEQHAVFRAAASRLVAGGLFVTECFVLDLSQWEPVRSIESHGDESIVRFGSWDPDTQLLSYEFHFTLGQEESVRYVQIRYASPEQTDAMATRAGFALVDRWGDWTGVPFKEGDPWAISVFNKPLAHVPHKPVVS